MRRQLSIRGRLTLGTALLATLTGIVAVVVVLSVTSSQLRERAKQTDARSSQSLQPNQQVGDPPGPGPNPRADRSTTQIRRIVDGQNAAKTISSSRRLGLKVVAGLTGVAILGAWFLAGRLLRPVKTMSTTARAVAAPGSGRRIPIASLSPGATGDELHQLAETINSMLDRIDISSESQRRFVADASHELRTPLTVLRTEVDVALDNVKPTVASHTASLKRTRTELVRMSSLVESLLHLSKSHTLNVREPYDLAIASEGAIAICKRLDLGPRRLEADLCSAPVYGDPVLLDRCILNLLENAFRYNHLHGLVSISTRANEQHSFVTIVNDGPPVADANRLFERFARGDRERLRNDGHGLGLAIVRSVVNSHGGSVAAVPRPAGGLLVEVVLNNSSNNCVST